MKQGYRGDILVAVDGGDNVILDRDLRLSVDGNYIINDYMYRVVSIDGNGTVYVKSV